MREGRPTVLVDMDGVLADFDAGIYSILQREHPDIPIKPGRTNFYIADDYPEEYELVKAISDQPGFFRTLPPITGYLEGWQAIIDLGFNPRICSSPLKTNFSCRAEKLEWLDHHLVPVFGETVITAAILDSNKHEYDGIALIDDKPKVRGSEHAVWRHILFDRPYNQGVQNSLRLVGWNDKRLPELLKQAHLLYRQLGQTACES